MTATASDGLHIAGISPPTAPARRRATGRIVVGVDGSPGSLAALRRAAAEAGHRSAALRIVCAWEDSHGGPAYEASPPAASVAAALVQDALDLVISLDGRLGSVSCVMPPGDPGRVLVEQAREAEMLILGTGSGAGSGKTRGYCLRFARCPVVFVRA